mgnify:CR=1 FL=1
MRVSGAGYVAVVPIYLAQSKGMVLVARPGQSCEKVPAEDLTRLEERGKILKVRQKKEQTDG